MIEIQLLIVEIVAVLVPAITAIIISMNKMKNQICNQISEIKSDLKTHIGISDFYIEEFKSNRDKIFEKIEDLEKD